MNLLCFISVCSLNLLAIPLRYCGLCLWCLLRIVFWRIELPSVIIKQQLTFSFRLSFLNLSACFFAIESYLPSGGGEESDNYRSALLLEK